MESYVKSVERVDLALQRLNATLASYRVSRGNDNNNTNAETSNLTRSVNSERPSAAMSTCIPEPSSRATSPYSMSEQSALETQENIPESNQDVWREVMNLSPDLLIASITENELSKTIETVIELQQVLSDDAYSLPLYLLLAHKFFQLGYPDLASGSAYKALLLSDAILDDSDEYHYQACEAYRAVITQQPLGQRIAILRTELDMGQVHASDDHANTDQSGADGDLPDDCDVEMDVWLHQRYLPMIYQMLSQSLLACGCLKTAHEYCLRGQELFPGSPHLQTCSKDIISVVAAHFKVEAKELLSGENHNPSMWPDSGLVRRECYPWNEFEPDRYQDLDELNELMSEVAPKLEIRAVRLPALGVDGSAGKDDFVTQLGVFAREDIAPGEVVLDETSLLTANNRLQDALCDACSADLPNLNDREAASAATVSCTDCEIVFCSQDCNDRAMLSYHPALCERDVDAIAKDVPPAEAADALYSLLLLRALAMAETQDCHPLELKEVKYIWGDFHSHLPVEKHWKALATSTSNACSVSDHGIPHTLPFSFEHNVRLPLHMLEKMDIDIFCAQSQSRYDVWVFNTLYAKFRGTASARLSGAGGGGHGSNVARGPEVCAVHPMWCMANHSCDPNVSWEWGGSIRFGARETRAVWQAPGVQDQKHGVDGEKGDGAGGVRNQPGIRRDEEVLNHYCDIDLSVNDRREWARGALGGDCMCERCLWESSSSSG